MAAHGSLAAELRSLTGDADDNVLADHLQRLIDGVRRSVSSYIGLTVAMTTNGRPVTLTVIDDTGRRRDQLACTVTIPLPLLGGAEAGSAMTFYAANPGAFTDLAADTAFRLGVPLDLIVTAEQVPVPHDDPVVAGLKEIGYINQAIGALIGTGHTHAAAESELQRLADAHGLTVANAARALVESILHPVAD